MENFNGFIYLFIVKNVFQFHKWIEHAIKNKYELKKFYALIKTIFVIFENVKVFKTNR